MSEVSTNSEVILRNERGLDVWNKVKAVLKRRVAGHKVLAAKQHKLLERIMTEEPYDPADWREYEELELRLARSGGILDALRFMLGGVEPDA